MKQGPLQDIVPFDCVDTVRELFVPEHKVPELRQEAETLPQLEITKLDTQWIQVQRFDYTRVFCFDRQLALSSDLAIVRNARGHVTILITFSVWTKTVPSLM